MTFQGDVNSISLTLWLQPLSQSLELVGAHSYLLAVGIDPGPQNRQTASQRADNPRSLHQPSQT